METKAGGKVLDRWESHVTLGRPHRFPLLWSSAEKGKSCLNSSLLRSQGQVPPWDGLVVVLPSPAGVAWHVPVVGLCWLGSKARGRGAGTGQRGSNFWACTAARGPPKHMPAARAWGMLLRGFRQRLPSGTVHIGTLVNVTKATIGFGIRHHGGHYLGRVLELHSPVSSFGGRRGRLTAWRASAGKWIQFSATSGSAHGLEPRPACGSSFID